MATRAECDERGSRRAEILAEAYASGRDALRRQAALHAGGAADPEDVVHDACAEFLRYYDGPPGAAALRYLMASVRHRAWALRARPARRRASNVELTATDAIFPGEAVIAVRCERPGPAERAERRERVGAIGAALAALKPDQRSALLLLAVGCSYREIAARQGWTRTKVNRSLAEGRAVLRVIAERGGSGPPRS